MTNAPTETMLESREDEVLSHSLEDYLEAIVDLAGPERKPIRAVDLANKLDVSKASVSKALTTLKAKSYVEQPYYGDVTLTEEGEEYGSYIWRKHNKLYKFLNETLGIEPELANYEACQMEHTISGDSFAKWEAFFEGFESKN